MSLTDTVYAHAPVTLQHVAVSAFGWRWRRRRFGGRFGEEVEGFRKRDRFDPDDWKRFQTARLREVLETCVTHVPYYRREWRELITPEQARRFELSDMPRLPLLEKEAVRRQPGEFLVDDVTPGGTTICPTSGSTGTPVRTYWTDSDFQRSLALREARGCLPAGVSYSLPRATFSGRLVVPAWQKGPPFHRFNFFERQVYFSAFHLAPQNATAYVAALVKHRIVWGTGYTHAWEQLAKFMIDQRIAPPPSLRAVITTSEPLTPEGRQLIERAFRCRVYQEYGMVEEVTWACEGTDRRMRVSPDAGLLEVLRPDGTAADVGEPGEAVATGFVRQSQIFVRYRIGDILTISPTADGSDRHMPVIDSIQGRVEDIVIGPDGQRTTRFHGIFTELVGCREAQIIQTARTQLRVRFAPDDRYSTATEDAIRTRIRARFGPSMQVTIEKVDAIPRTKAGKFRAVVNLVLNPRALDNEADPLSSGRD